MLPLTVICWPKTHYTQIIGRAIRQFSIKKENLEEQDESIIDIDDIIDPDEDIG